MTTLISDTTSPSTHYREYPNYQLNFDEQSIDVAHLFPNIKQNNMKQEEEKSLKIQKYCRRPVISRSDSR